MAPQNTEAVIPTVDSQPHRPNFFIVGAPKCGTTSMYHYLRSHPDIYMPYDANKFWKTKEPQYFADDLGIAPNVRINSLDAYMALFTSVSNESRSGEASALYLYSANACAAVKAFCPEAKVIIMLRPPVDLMRSWHRDCLRFGHEDILDFTEAVAAEEARHRGERVPPNCAYPSRLIYTKMGAYAQHVERYLKTFGKANLKVILLEDLHTKPKQTYQETLNFLEVDTSFLPDFTIHHQSQVSGKAQVESQKIKLLILKKARFIFNIFQKIPPKQQELLRSLYSKAIPPKAAPEIPQAFLNMLRHEFKSDIDQLSGLIDRDLQHWYTI